MDTPVVSNSDPSLLMNRAGDDLWQGGMQARREERLNWKDEVIIETRVKMKEERSKEVDEVKATSRKGKANEGKLK